MRKVVLLLVVVLILVASGFLIVSHNATQPGPTSTSPTSTQTQTIPSARSVGEPVPFQLTVPSGYTIGVFAKDLGNPRDLAITPSGTILVSIPNSNSVIALADTNGDFIAEKKTVVHGSNVVHGLALHNGDLYVAEKNSVSRYSWNEEQKTATFERKLLSLPGEQNHVYRTLVFDSDGKMYISIGSNCNVCEESNPMVGTVIVTNEDGTNPQEYARGQRNAPFLITHPSTGHIWATGMGRDNLGDKIPPDEINLIREGDYGWPTCYGNKVHDTNFDKKTYIQDPCTNTISPVYEIPAHSAPLGLAFIPKEFNETWAGDLFVAYHGSWNSSIKVGYKVVRMNVSGERITNEEDFLTGFLSGGSVLARPVDIIFDKSGNMYLSDDRSGYVFIVRKSTG